MEYMKYLNNYESIMINKFMVRKVKRFNHNN